MTEEKTFFNEGGITVTNSRIVAGDETYAMNGVTSVKMAEEKSSHKGPIIVMIIGVAALTGSGGAIDMIISGLVIIALGVLWWKKKKSVYYVVLRTASGESQAYNDTDKNQITSIVNAINNAIIARG